VVRGKLIDMGQNRFEYAYPSVYGYSFFAYQNGYGFLPLED
jgi:hypothetical protein